MTIRSSVRSICELVAPKATRRFRQSQWIKFHTRELKSLISRADGLEARVEVVRGYLPLRSNQKSGEIVSLLRRLENLKCCRICEIGADRGGTLALFASIAAPEARILSIDLKYRESSDLGYPRLAGPRQKISCLEANSHASETLRHVKRWLRGQLLDFLFVDGDHSYVGVKADYEMYGPLVREGGIIAFHDIVPDFRMRFGVATSTDVGEVPRFWQELKARCESTEEFIEDPEQDGYGIGVVRVARSSAVLA